MRKLLVGLLAITSTVTAFAQTSTSSDKLKKAEIISRAGDHFMLQLAQNSWTNTPDAINDHLKGFNRSINAYLMLNKPFKSDPRFSVGLGVGVGTSNMYFKNMSVGVAGSSSVLQFTPTDSLDHYKKYKLATSYAEIPVEFRFTSDAYTPNKAIKAAIGLKIGTMINAHTKGKELISKTGSTIHNATDKVSSKSYFNTTRLAATGRVGYGIFTLFCSYGLTPIFKDGVAEDMKLVQFGLTISGL